MPLGKLKTERLVPVDSFVCQLVDRLRLLRSQDPLPADGFLLARPSGRNALIRKLRSFWRDIVATVGITKRIVPHQLRHSFGTEMLRAGVSLPAVMKLLGHLKPEMTMRYLEVSLPDLQREFHLARSQPRHLLPASRLPASISSPQANLASLLDSLRLSLSTFWKCSAAPFPKDPIVVSSTASPIGSPRSLQKHENSGKAKSRQRLAGVCRISFRSQALPLLQRQNHSLYRAYD